MDVNDAARLARVAELETENTQLREVVRVIWKSVHDEPELPGQMPDDVWKMLNGDRDMTQLALVRVVQATKRGIIERINANPIASAAVKSQENTNE